MNFTNPHARRATVPNRSKGAVDGFDHRFGQNSAAGVPQTHSGRNLRTRFLLQECNPADSLRLEPRTRISRSK